LSGKIRQCQKHCHRVENDRKCGYIAIEISLISHPIPDMQCTSGLSLSVLASVSLAISDNVRNIVIESGMIENVDIAVEISLISQTIPEMQCTSGLRSPVLTSGSLALSDNVRLYRQCCH